MWSRPNAASAVWMAASMSFWRATSQRTASALLPIRDAAAWAAPSSRSSTATRAPSRAKVSAMQAPMPEPAPVMTAVLLARRMGDLGSWVGRGYLTSSSLDIQCPLMHLRRGRRDVRVQGPQIHERHHVAPKPDQRRVAGIGRGAPEGLVRVHPRERNERLVGG